MGNFGKQIQHVMFVCVSVSSFGILWKVFVSIFLRFFNFFAYEKQKMWKRKNKSIKRVRNHEKKTKKIVNRLNNKRKIEQLIELTTKLINNTSIYIL